jgi:hypothetical protein
MRANNAALTDQSIAYANLVRCNKNILLGIYKVRMLNFKQKPSCNPHLVS